MKPLALVGCAHIHTPDFIRKISARKDVKIASVWDYDPARSKKIAEQTAATAVDDLQRICGDSHIEAAIVCTETNLHEKVVLPLAAAKKNLFIEKPLGFSSADARVMAETIEKAGVIFQTGYAMRGDPKILFLKQQVDSGKFGKITRIRGSTCHSGALGRWFDTDYRWMADPKIAGCGAFGDLGTHSLDILLWLIGDVSAVTAQLDPGTETYPGCDETGEAMLRFKSGVIGTLAAAWDDVANPVSLLISGTDGHAAIINDQLHFQSKQVAACDGAQPLRTAELPPARNAGLDAFLDAVAGVPAALVTVREAAYRSVVMEAMYQAALERKWMTLT